MHNVLKKEKDIISYREIESEKIAGLMEEVRVLKEELTKVKDEKKSKVVEVKEKIVKNNKPKPLQVKTKKPSKTVRLLKDKIKELELVHKKFKKSGKHKKELKIIETKLKSFKAKLKKS